MKKREVQAGVSGFTPVPDVLSKKYGAVTALVFGLIWRYSQMEDEVCRASLDRIGQDIGATGRTVQNHIKVLEKDGYIKDLTPGVRNEPHQYQDTGKIRMKVWIGMGEEVGKNFSPRSEKISIEESTTNGVVIKNIYAMYESNIGVLTPVIADTLDMAEKEYPADWLAEAIKLAVLNNKRNWRYCEAILRRWKTAGKDDGLGKKEETQMVELL